MQCTAAPHDHPTKTKQVQGERGRFFGDISAGNCGESAREIHKGLQVEFSERNIAFWILDYSQAKETFKKNHLKQLKCPVKSILSINDCLIVF